MARALRAGERIEIGDVAGRTRNRQGPEKWSDTGLLYSYHLLVAQVSRPPALAAASGLDFGALSGLQGHRALAGRPPARAGPS